MRPSLPSQRARTYLSKKARSQMTSQVTVLRPDTPQFNQSTGVMTSRTQSTGYSGPAHIFQLTGPQMDATGDEVTIFRTTQVSIPQEATPIPRRDDLVRIDTTDDPALLGKHMRILDVTAGGIISPTRTLTCSEVEPNEFWPQA